MGKPQAAKKLDATACVKPQQQPAAGPNKKQKAPSEPVNPPVPKKAKKTSEIDDIFSLGSSKAAAPAAAGSSDTATLSPELQAIADQIRKAREDKAKGAADAQLPAKKARVEGSKDDLFGGEAARGSRKRTEEGYAIYTEDELSMAGGKGGDTDLCPFDCDCCF